MFECEFMDVACVASYLICMSLFGHQGCPVHELHVVSVTYTVYEFIGHRGFPVHELHAIEITRHLEFRDLLRCKEMATFPFEMN
ncbi:uncharacterized protein G2W53_010223 [Senna tora]|uniref:Uncharacterized protein n=1 Tax=Senna tora TaxID=362788 RepID=A0A835C9E2_9FABA|nr:uncharacterized protein G2W53_010223 [Senna tora]